MSEEISMMELSSREMLSIPGMEDDPVVISSPEKSPPSSPINFPPASTLEVEAEGAYVWTVENYSQQPEKIYSPEFTVGKTKWKILLHPHGNEPHVGKCASLYLVAIPPPSEEDNPNWAVCAQFIATMEHPLGNGLLVSKFTQHRFDTFESDWGYSNFCHLRTLAEGDVSTNNLPLLQNDSVMIKVRVRVIKDSTGILWHNFINYDSKQVTGYVGLANQGATCYMNSLLQSLYFVNEFRRAIYMIPTEGERPVDNSALALQRIFWRLQHSNSPVSTGELTKAFGWDSLESFIQSDVQEFSRVLLDELESKLKATKGDGIVERLFVGKVRNVIKCLNVPFESTRTENFYDLQLPIKGVTTLEESFAHYVKAEMLEGDNKYMAEGFGLQDAKRFVEFEELPPVLHLHLERYAFDPRVLATIKINDRLEFPLQINLKRYLWSESPQRGIDQTFILQSVFVHSGDSHGGHYYVFIRNLRCNDGEWDGRWYRFDDTKVIPATEKEAVEDTFGGDQSALASPAAVGMDEVLDSPEPMMTRSTIRTRDKYRKFTNAYMLVYIRKAEIDSVLCSVEDEKDIPLYIGEAIRHEDELEKRRKLERHMALTNVKVRVLTEELLRQHSGYDLFNISNKNLPSASLMTIKIPKTSSIRELKQQIAEEMGTEVDHFRLWTFYPRRNKTTRLDEPIDSSQYYKSVSSLISRVPIPHSHVVLYAELIDPKAPPPSPGPSLIMIGLKFYDPMNVQLRFVEHVYVDTSATIETLFPKMRELANLPNDAPIQCYEEIKVGRIDLIDSTKTLSENQLQTGDIICFQVKSAVEEDLSFPRVSDYLRDLCNYVFVQFRLESGEEFASLRLSLDTDYNLLLQSIGEKVSADPKHIRLHIGDENGDNPIALRAEKTLSDTICAMTPSNADTDGIVLWIEIAPVAVAELEKMKRIHLTVVSDLAIDADASIGECNIYISQNDTVALIYDRLPENIRAHIQPPIRMVEVHNHRIFREFIGDDSIITLNENSEVYVEGPIAPEELSFPTEYRLLSCFFYWRDVSRTHGRPFRQLVLPHETFAACRKRLEKRLNASDINIKLYGSGKLKTIDDCAILTNEMEPGDQFAIERADPTSRPVGIEHGIRIRSSTPRSTAPTKVI